MSRLPLQLTSFVGRESELAQARGLIGESRLVTLVGQGGVGKTRLAAEAAAGFGAEVGEVWFCDLSSAGSAEAVLQLLAEALGVEDGHDLAARFSCGPGVLILDNCEHVLDAAVDAALALLEECGSLRILATSRVELHVPGEQVVRVRPLDQPDTADVEGVAAAPATRLFVERARQASTGFEVTAATAGLVAEICATLGGLPLALELAAAQLRAMSLETLSRSLRDRFRVLVAPGRRGPIRHQTLEAAVRWSVELLAEGERVVLFRLSVEAAPFSAATAEAVAAGDEVAAGDVLLALSRLVDSSLLDFDPKTARYDMAETVRAYGLRALSEAGEAVDVRDRAAAEADSRRDHWAALAHLQAALEMLPGDNDRRRDLLDRLAWQAEQAGHYRAGVDALVELDGLLAGPEQMTERATAQLRLSSFLPMATGDLQGAEAAVRKALALTEATGDRGRALAVETQLAWARSYRGEVAEAAAAARSVAARAEAAGERTVLRHALGAAGAAEVVLGRFESGVEALERGLALARTDDDPGQAAWFASLLAFSQGLEGRLAAGRARLEEARALVEIPEALMLDTSGFLDHMTGNNRGLVEDVRRHDHLLSRFQVRGIWVWAMAAAAAAELGQAALAHAYARQATELTGGDSQFFYQSRAMVWMLGLASWALGDNALAVAQLRSGAESLLAIGAVPLACLALRDLADLLIEVGLDGEAARAEADLATAVRGLPPALREALTAPPAEAAIELGRLGYWPLRARALERAGRLEEAAAAHEQLGSRWRRDRLLAQLAASGQASVSPGARTLSSLVLFEGIPATELEELAGRLTPALYTNGDAVFRRFEEAQRVHVVESGSIRLSLNTRTATSVLTEIGAGELLGERALLEDELWATDAHATSPSRVLSLDARDLLRFIETRPLVAERTLTLVRQQLRREARLAGDPEPVDVAARLLGSVQRLSATEGRSLPAYEILPVYLEAGSPWLLRPVDAASLQVQTPPAAVPSEVVEGSLRDAGLQAEIVHSTSWRYESERLVLTYLAILPAAADPSGFQAIPVLRAELARGTARGAPSQIDVGQVVEHGLRHLSWLSRDDPVIREELSLEWRELVGRYVPEPFRAL